MIFSTNTGDFGRITGEDIAAEMRRRGIYAVTPVITPAPVYTPPALPATPPAAPAEPVVVVPPGEGPPAYYEPYIPYYPYPVTEPEEPGITPYVAPVTVPEEKEEKKRIPRGAIIVGCIVLAGLALFAAKKPPTTTRTVRPAMEEEVAA